MTNRRRLLLSYLANSFKYLPYSYEYLYYGLVPTTISGKAVKNKAKVSKLYGNSVMENQLLNIPSSSKTTTINGITLTDNRDGSYTLNGTATALTEFNTILTNIEIVNGHSYLLYGSYNFNANFYMRITGLGNNTSNASLLNATSSTTTGTFKLVIDSGVSLNNVLIIPQLTDLTQKYPFDTPTTLTDNRVQAILNRGYIPFNLGELKSVDIGEISSEPYNLFDESWKQGDPNGSQTTVVSGTNFIDVVGGLVYSLEATSSVSVQLAICKFYDESNTLIGELIRSVNSTTISVSNFTVPTNAKKCKIQLNTSGALLSPSDISNSCFHLTGTRTGYAPYKAPQTISFKYQGSGVGTAHDTYELTKTAHVFTKRIGLRPYQSGDESLSNVLTDMTNTLYQLATPQVISIPRKHLGVVRIRDLSWEKYSSSNNYYAQATDKAFGQTNMYCSQFLTTNQASASGQNMNDLEIGGSNANRYFYIKVLSASTTTDFLNKYGDCLIFYETENEVADITDTFDIQSGGTINTDSNVLPNADFLMKCK